jgi:hypothetical protein
MNDARLNPGHVCPRSRFSTLQGLVLVSCCLIGTLAHAVSFIGTNIGGGGNGLALADVNGDGKLDILEANGNLTVLLGNGDGTFQPIRQFVGAPNSTSVVAVDLNGDGNLDAVLTDSSGSVYTFLGNGDGTFQTSRQFSTGTGFNPISIVAADFNGDGKMDVVVGDQGCASGCSMFTVTLMLGNGDGTLGTPKHINIPSLPYALAVGDFNKDNKKDLAVMVASDVVILLGDGDGTFQPPLSNSLSSGAQGGIAIADLNRDGNQDIVVGTGNVEAVAVLLGNGNGTFGAPKYFYDPLADVPSAVAVGDFNGDGIPDIATGESGCCPSTSSSAVSVIQGNGDGTFGSYQRFIIPGASLTPNAAEYIVTGDFNADGKTDMAMIMGGVIGGTVYMKNTTGSTPASFSLGSLTLSPSTVAGGGNSRANVMLVPGAVTPMGSKQIAMSSSNTNAATVPSNAEMIAGMNNVFVQVLTNSGVTSTSTSTIAASSGNRVSGTLTVTAGTPPVISSLVISPSTVMSGNGANGTITLSGPAPSGDATVNLTSSDSTVASVPATATVPQGQTQGVFSIYSGTVSTSKTATVTATYSTSSKSATLTVNPQVNVAVSSLTLNPASVAGGASSTATVTLVSAAPSGGQAVNIGSSTIYANPSVVTLTIPAGQTSGTFTVNTTSPPSTTTAQLSASSGGATVYANLTITAGTQAPALSSVTLNPTSVTGGSGSIGTVTLSAVATSGTAVSLSSSNTSAAKVPSSVTVAAGATSATFTVTTSKVYSNTSSTITATLNGASKAAVLTVTRR